MSNSQLNEIKSAIYVIGWLLYMGIMTHACIGMAHR